MINCNPEGCRCEWCSKTEAEKISALLAGIEANAAAAEKAMPLVGDYVRLQTAEGCRKLMLHVQRLEQLAAWTNADMSNVIAKCAGSILVPLIKQRLLQLQAEAAAKTAGGAP